MTARYQSGWQKKSGSIIKFGNSGTDFKMIMKHLHSSLDVLNLKVWVSIEAVEPFSVLWLWSTEQKCRFVSHQQRHLKKLLPENKNVKNLVDWKKVMAKNKIFNNSHILWVDKRGNLLERVRNAQKVWEKFDEFNVLTTNTLYYCRNIIVERDISIITSNIKLMEDITT